MAGNLSSPRTEQDILKMAQTSSRKNQRGARISRTPNRDSHQAVALVDRNCQEPRQKRVPSALQRPGFALLEALTGPAFMLLSSRYLTQAGARAYGSRRTPDSEQSFCQHFAGAWPASGADKENRTLATLTHQLALDDLRERLALPEDVGSRDRSELS